jgi:hypothetical protein
MIFDPSPDSEREHNENNEALLTSRKNKYRE